MVTITTVKKPKPANAGKAPKEQRRKVPPPAEQRQTEAMTAVPAIAAPATVAPATAVVDLATVRKAGT